MQAEYIIFSNDGKQRGKIMANATIIPLKNSYSIRGFVEGHTQATGGAPPPPPFSTSRKKAMSPGSPRSRAETDQGRSLPEMSVRESHC